MGKSRKPATLVSSSLCGGSASSGGAAVATAVGVVGSGSASGGGATDAATVGVVGGGSASGVVPLLLPPPLL